MFNGTSGYRQPIVQVLGLRRIVGVTTERYSVVLSNGDKIETSTILSIQSTDFVHQLTENAIIRIEQYLTSVIR